MSGPRVKELGDFSGLEKMCILNIGMNEIGKEVKKMGPPTSPEMKGSESFLKKAPGFVDIKNKAAAAAVGLMIEDHDSLMMQCKELRGKGNFLTDKKKLKKEELQAYRKELEEMKLKLENHIVRVGGNPNVPSKEAHAVNEQIEALKYLIGLVDTKLPQK